MTKRSAKPRRFQVTWAQTALRDAEEILDFLRAESPAAARKLLARLRRKAATLETLPHRGRRLPELEDLHLPDFREVQEPPYRMIYRIDDEDITVLAVLDSRRQLEDLLLLRLIKA